MSTFSDDFNRANGGIGNNWQYFNAGGVISSNTLVMPQYGYNYQPSCSASGRQEVTLRFQSTAAVALGAGIILKWSSTGPAGYVCVVTGTGSAPTYHIKRLTSGNYVTDYNVAGSSLSDGWHTLRALYFEGVITVWVDGALVVQTADSTHGALTGAGIHSWVANQAVDDFYFLGDESVTLSVSPSPIGNFGNSTTVTFTGVATAWTTGTPGTPTFTVDHGTLSGQEVVSATSATATYTPGTFLGIATFADPSTGATCLVTVTSDTTVVFPPSGAGGFSEEAVAWIEAQAAHGGLVIQEQDTPGGEIIDGYYSKGALGEVLIGKRYITGTTPAPTPPTSLLQDIYARLWAGEEWQSVSFAAAGTDSLKADATFLRDRWASSVTPWTVEQLVTALGGDPLASHQDILDALSNLSPTVDLQPVLDAIAAAQGDPLATTKAVLDLVYLLDPTGTHNLAEVLTAIGAVRGTGSPDLAAVMTKLSQVQPSTSYTLSSLNTQGVDLKQLLDTLALVIGIVAPEAGTVAELIALIYDAVTATPEPVATVGPPVWIDEAHATIDSPVALSDGLLLEGPMDGVIVTITGARAGAGKFAFGDVTSWRYCGAVVFGTDRGDWEWAQPIGLASQIVTCKTMQHASSALFRLESGFTGTVQPFTVTAGT